MFSKEAAPILYDEPMELIVTPRNPLNDVYYCAWFVFSEAMGGRVPLGGGTVVWSREGYCLA